MKSYNQSPLPFQGQKRGFAKAFKACLRGYDESYTYVDLFGGSGLLSHIAKQTFPTSEVVYNDYDNFTNRLQNITRTNALLSEIRGILKDYPRKQAITDQLKKDIIGAVRAANEQGFVDYITLSGNLIFSMNYAFDLDSLVKERFYNRVRISDYNADGYLDGVTVVRSDYKTVFNQFKDVERVVFLIDPPYLNTDTTSYSSNQSWQLHDYLDVLLLLVDQNYFYFTSNKSQIVELCEWFVNASFTSNPFISAERWENRTTTSHNTGYTDIMYHYKKKEDE